MPVIFVWRVSTCLEFVAGFLLSYHLWDWCGNVYLVMGMFSSGFLLPLLDILCPSCLIVVYLISLDMMA